MSYKEKIIAVAVIVGGAQAYDRFFSDKVNSNLTSERKKVVAESKSYDSNRFRCDGRQHCSQMNSRKEAEFFIRNCPNTKMDGDNDGIPCENDSRW